MKIDATFEITRWDAAPYDEPAEGPPSSRIVVGKTYAGPLAGESLAELLTTGELAYVANERVTGTLDGRTGTFVLQHGAWEGGQWGYVVPGSGTGGLAGLRGAATLDHGTIELAYEFS